MAKMYHRIYFHTSGTFKTHYKLSFQHRKQFQNWNCSSSPLSFSRTLQPSSSLNLLNLDFATFSFLFDYCQLQSLGNNVIYDFYNYLFFLIIFFFSNLIGTPSDLDFIVVGFSNQTIHLYDGMSLKLSHLNVLPGQTFSDTFSNTLVQFPSPQFFSPLVYEI